MLIIMLTFIIAIDNKALFQRIENYHAQEGSSLTILLHLVRRKFAGVPLILELGLCGHLYMPFGVGPLPYTPFGQRRP